ncbi:MAG TPA: TetR/AcrR family transcriptional regulator [Rugosimonospora sp.]|nr:TetR/AcrR family transcriptional regulator [Rugosimonospora sp.]
MWGVTTETVEAVGATDQDRKAPGRPRSARADEAIIEAVLDLLAEGTSAEALSIEAVAARAGVGKATIYRRWSNKESLIVDAVAKVKGEPPPLAGESLRDDLLALLRPVDHGDNVRAGRIIPCLLSEIRRSPELRRCWQRITEPRRELIRGVLRRGIAADELRADLDIEMTLAMLMGPLIARNAMLWDPGIDTSELVSRLVDAVLAGAARC